MHSSSHVTVEAGRAGRHFGSHNLNPRPDINQTAFILIDHQVGTSSWARSTKLEILQKNVIALAKFAKGMNLPLVLTSSQEENTKIQGPLMPELQQIAPMEFEQRVKRQGVVNAWDDPAFADAVRRTGRKHLVMAGVTTDVCMVGPVISAIEEGFEVWFVADACGSPNDIAEAMAHIRLQNAGAHMTSANAVISDLVKNWASPAGAVAFPLLNVN